MNFNVNRFITLIRRDLIIFKKPLLYGLLLLPLFIGMICYLQGISDDMLDAPFLLNWIGAFLFIGGAFFTTSIFWEFRSGPERAQYLTLPASNLEKLLSRWIYTLILYPLYLALIFWFISKANGIVFSNQEKEIFGIFAKVYTLGHSIFFMFAVWYNRYVAAKSVLTIWLLALIMVVVISILFRIIFMDVFEGASLEFNDSVRIDPKNENFPDWVEKNVFPLVKGIFWYVLPLFFWVVAYFKMQEKEA